MAHQSPRRYEPLVKLDGSHEIQRTLLMISSQTIIVANHTATLRSEFVVLEELESQMGKVCIVLAYVQDVTVEVKVLIAIRIELEESLEHVGGLFEVMRQEVSMGHLVHQVDALLELVCQEVRRDFEGFFRLAFFQEETSQLKVTYPVLGQVLQCFNLLVLHQLCQLQPRRPKERHLPQRCDQHLLGLILVSLALENETVEVQVGRR